MDSLYVSQIIQHIYQAYLSPSLDEQLLSLFLTLQNLIQVRQQPFFVAHIRSHQPFPGPLQEGNDRADLATQMDGPQVQLLHVVSPPTPWESHSYFHQNKKSLMKQFGLSVSEASAIIQQCPTCSQQASALPMGVNPRGTQANQVWQMDVTHYPAFNPWKYVHVTVDTFSGFIMATPQRGQAVKHVINHCIRTFASLGRPSDLKTDNGPSYSSAAFAAFCNKWGICHKFGIPYNSQGQAIVERANQTLKNALKKTQGSQGKITLGLPAIQDHLNITLYALNFLNLSGSPPASAADRHFSSVPTAPSRPPVYYRELPDPTWHGPAPLLTWGRGYAAIQLPDRVLWVPGRHVRPFLPKAVKLAENVISSSTAN